MLWMGIWVHPYTATPIPIRVGVGFRKIGAWLSLSDVVMSWLRLQTPKDCIPQPWHIYLYAQCFSSLRCCGWAYGCTLTLLCLYGWGGIVRKMGYGRACMMLWCHGWGCKHPPASHIHIGIGGIQSVWAPWDAVDEHRVGAPLCWYLWRWEVGFRINGWLSPVTTSLVDISVRWLKYLVSKMDCTVLNSPKGFWRSLPQRSHSFLDPNLKTWLTTHWYPFPLHSQGWMLCKQQSDILTVYQTQFFA